MKRTIEDFRRIDSFMGDEAPSYIFTETIQTGIKKSEYYKCPVCGRRARYLYDLKDALYYACRVCLGADYNTQRMTRDEKATAGARKALERMGVDTDGMSPWDIMHYPVENIEKELDKYYKCRGKWYDSMAEILKSPPR